MKKLLFIVAMIFCYTLVNAQDPTYTQVNSDKDSKNLTATIIEPITVTVLYVPPVPLPTVITGFTRTFAPGTPTGMPDAYINGSNGNFGWVFKLTKQAGPELNLSSNSSLDPYRARVDLNCADDASTIKVKLGGKWYFYDRDLTGPVITPSLSMAHSFPEDQTSITWFSDETEALLAFYLETIDATQQLTARQYDFLVKVTVQYTAI